MKKQEGKHKLQTETQELKERLARIDKLLAILPWDDDGVCASMAAACDLRRVAWRTSYLLTGASMTKANSLRILEGK